MLRMVLSGLGYVVVLGGSFYVAVYYRFTHPDQTETQIFLNNIGTVGALLILALLVAVLQTDWKRRHD